MYNIFFLENGAMYVSKLEPKKKSQMLRKIFLLKIFRHKKNEFAPFPERIGQFFYLQ